MVIEAYKSGAKYKKYQRLRPDYTQAIATSIDLIYKHVKERENVIISDFCCGTGENTRKLANKLKTIKKALLIDINAGFLQSVNTKNIGIDELMIYNKNILDVVFNKESDIVLSIFAYHHIMDTEKAKYIIKIKDALKNGGFLVLTEIFIPSVELSIQYYDKIVTLISHKDIARDVMQGFTSFLNQTAKSTDFEYKVSKEFADRQFLEAGFKKIEEVKIRPLDDQFDHNIGAFVQIYTLS